MMEKKVNGLSFLDHLDELRVRFIRSLCVFVLACFIFYPFAPSVLKILVRPVGYVIFTAPEEAFLTQLKLTILGGLLLSLPYALLEIWAFFSVGLTVKEKKYVIVFAPLSLLLFAAGCAGSYFFVIPVVLKFLLGFAGTANGIVVPMITLEKYISFIGGIVLAFGIISQMPLLLFFFIHIGIATPAFLIQHRKWAIVAVLILSAILTPPDVISLILMAVPLLVLYELGILFARIKYKG